MSVGSLFSLNWAVCIVISNAHLDICGLKSINILTLVPLNPDIPAFANSVDPDQLASSEANWSGSALFAIKYVNLYQQSGSSNLTGWKL